MNKYKDALDEIRCALIVEKNDGSFYIECQEDINLIEELVDRTTPQKPINKHVLKQFGICPSCNADVNIRYHVVACGKCGKYLDWSNDGPTK